MLSTLLSLGLALSAVARECPQVKSCSRESKDVDPCCSPSAGLFVFRQRFEPDGEGDMGTWGIDGLEVLECVYLYTFFIKVMKRS
jgi:ribonuclease T2